MWRFILGIRSDVCADFPAVNQRVLSLKLEQMGISNVQTASSGLEALSVARSAAVPFDVILMDVWFLCFLTMGEGRSDACIIVLLWHAKSGLPDICKRCS